MANLFNPDLLTDLAYRKVVLFLGAGVSASAITTTGTKIAGWAAFLQDCTTGVPDPLKSQILVLIGEKDYLLACELLQQHHKDDWIRLVSKEFGQKAQPSALHRAILNLKQRVILTTNFDKLIDIAWSEVANGGTHFPTTITKIDSKIFRILKEHEENYLLKIHGTVDDPDSLIFSRSEYIRMAFGNRDYSNFIDSLLLNYTFLFVGFSMDDPAITSLMEMYALRYPSARPHYIFSPQGMPENIIKIYKDLRKLVVLPYDDANNHEKLPEIISELGRQSWERYRRLASQIINSINKENEGI